MRTDNDLVDLYKRVQKKDREAERQLISYHKRKFPKHPFHDPENKELVPGGSSHYRENLHMIYLHLTR